MLLCRKFQLGQYWIYSDFKYGRDDFTTYRLVIKLKTYSKSRRDDVIVAPSFNWGLYENGRASSPVGTTL